MIDDKDFERIYQEYLEEDIISYLAKIHNISLEKAMDLYYNSQIAEKIHQGKYGIQYLDYKILAEMV
ncbi:MAG: hypothetical protein J6W29_04545 [Neisseriaceae bacterium]|nr:hypothetical protein [Neisseriaceae bacterium]